MAGAATAAGEPAEADPLDDEDVAEVAFEEAGRDDVAEAPAVVQAPQVAEPSPYDEPMPAWLKPTAPVVAPAEVVPESRNEPKPVLLFEASRQFDRPALETPAAPEPSARDEAGWLAGDMAAVAPLNPAPAGRERLELAIAYLDLGDAETARTLLSEVAAGSDPQARAEAAELLGRLG